MANLKQYTKTSFQDYGLPSDPKNNVDQHEIRKDINYLYDKIKDFSRETTQWDLYKITDVIQNQENFQGQINALPPYSSAIIAAKFVENNELYSPGDLVYKKLDNSTEHITAERGGVFYPSKIVQGGNNIDMYFTYMTKEPSASNASTAEPLDTGDGYGFSSHPNSQTLIYENIGITATSTVYGYVYEPNGATYYSFDNKNIYPIIKLYNEFNEEVYTDIELTLSSDNEQYTINNIPSIVAKVVVK